MLFKTARLKFFLTCLNLFSPFLWAFEPLSSFSPEPAIIFNKRPVDETVTRLLSGHEFIPVHNGSESDEPINDDGQPVDMTVLLEVDRASWFRVVYPESFSVRSEGMMKTVGAEGIDLCIKPGHSYRFSDTHGVSRNIHLLATPVTALGPGTTECVLDIPLNPETLDVRRLDASSKVLERRYFNALTGAVEHHAVMHHREDVTPSFMILLEEKKNGQRFLVIFSIDAAGSISTHTVYLDNQNDRTFNELSLEEVSIPQGETCRLKNRMGFLFVQCVSGTRQSSEPLMDGEYEIGLTEDGVFIRTAQTRPRFLQLPTVVRTRAFRGWGFKLVDSTKMASIVAKKPADLRGVVTERWSADEDFDRFSKLSEQLYKLVKMSSDRPKQGSPTYGKSDEELGQYWQQIPKLIGKVLAEQLKTVGVLSAFKSRLGIGTPTYTVSIEEVGGTEQRGTFTAEAFAIQIARDLVGFLMKRGYRDLWPAYMEMLFAARNIGVAKVMDFSAGSMISDFYRVMAGHELWQYVDDSVADDVLAKIMIALLLNKLIWMTIRSLNPETYMEL